MELVKGSETLEEDSLKLKLPPAQNSCNKTQEKTSGSSELFLACGISTAGGAGANNTCLELSDGRQDFDANVNDDFIVCNASSESEFEEGDTNGLSIEVSGTVGIKNGDVSALAVSSLISGNKELGAKKVEMVATETKGSSSHVQHVDSDTKIEVSGDSISLFVDFFGPRNGNLKVDESKQIKSHQQNLRRANGELILCNGKDAKFHLSEDYDWSGDVSRNGSIVPVVDGGNDLDRECTETQQCEFFMDDLVWINTKVQTWWPGQICGLKGSRNAVDSDGKDCLFVKYFGSANSLWCSPSQLKPFSDHFEQFSREGSSRNFRNAVERAVCEFRLRLGLRISCSCASKENQSALVKLADGKKRYSFSKGRMGKEVEILLNQYEPASFLTNIKNLATSAKMHGTMELTVIQCRLSAFSHYTGHLQLPLHQLRPKTDSKDSVQEQFTSEKKNNNLTRHFRKDRHLLLLNCGGDVAEKGLNPNDPESNLTKPDTCRVDEAKGLAVCTTVSCEGANNGYGLRDRRRSKYLSPPYVMLRKGDDNTPMSSEQGTENIASSCKTVTDSNPAGKNVDAAPVANCSGKKSQKNGSKITKTGHNTCNKKETINLSLAEIISEMHFTALNCFHARESRHFDSVEHMLLTYRKIAFRDEINHGIVNGCASIKKEQTDYTSFLQAVLGEIQVQKGVQTGKSDPGCERIIASVTLDADKISNCTNSAVKDVHAIASTLLNVVSKPKRKKRKESNAAVASTNSTTYLPDVNENPCGSGSPVTLKIETDNVASKGELDKKRRKRKTMASLDLQEKRATKIVTGLPDLNGDVSNVSVDDTLVASPVVPQSKTIPTKGSGNEEADLKGIEVRLKDVNDSGADNGQIIKGGAKMDINGSTQMFSSGLNSPPDSHGTSVSSTSSAKGSSRVDLLFPVSKPFRKRKRKEKASAAVASAVPDLNGNVIESNPMTKDSRDTNPSKRKHQKKRRKINESIAGVPLTYDEFVTNRASPGTALILNFSTEDPLPSKESLLKTFCSFGPLKQWETNISPDGSAKVVFVRSFDAGNAIRNMEQNNHFGPGLKSYHLQSPVAAPESRSSELPEKSRVPAKPKPPCLKPNQGDSPDLLYIKQNLELMTSMLEKAGNNLSLEMRAKLEGEIKGLMAKVSAMVGPSSSAPSQIPHPFVKENVHHPF